MRGRLGVTVTPTALLYATGGLAYGDVKTAGILTGYNANGAVLTSAFANNSANAGWTVGAGIEGQLVGNWTGKLEYLYMDLSNRAYSITGVNNGLESNILRFGINYHF